MAAEVPVAIGISQARSIDEFGDKGPVGSVEVGKYTYVEQEDEFEFNYDRVNVDGVVEVLIESDFVDPANIVPPPLYLTFDIQHQGGLHTDQVFSGGFYEGNVNAPFTGQIRILYGTSHSAFGFISGPATTLATFDISPDWADVGETFSFNIYDVITGFPALGNDVTFLLEAVSLIPENTAWTFNNFRLTKTDQTSAVPNTAVPEPGAWALMILGFGAVGAAMRSRRMQLSRSAA